MNKKHHEPCVLFLEDVFGAAHAERLKQAGFAGVVRFVEHFHNENQRTEQAVKDPRIITLCDEKGWLLVTPDSNMHKTHTESIKRSKVSILAMANNNSDIDEWVEGLIKAKAEVERHFKKYERPWFATFSREGKVTSIQTIGPGHKSRRNRPREAQELPVARAVPAGVKIRAAVQVITTGVEVVKQKPTKEAS